MRIDAARGVHLAGVRIDRINQQQAIAHILGTLNDGHGGTLVTPNVDILRLCSESSEWRTLINDADVSIADGVPLVWLSRLVTGTPLTRLAGSDLAPALLAAAAAAGYRSMWLGGGPGVAEQASVKTGQKLPPHLRPAHYRPAVANEFAAQDFEVMSERISLEGVKIVFVCLGFPKQEQVLHRLHRRHGDVWFLGVGAAVDFAAGRVQRAPAAVGKLGLEWAYRLAQEPRRLTGRYLRHDLVFLCKLTLNLVLPRFKHKRSRRRCGS